MKHFLACILVVASTPIFANNYFLSASGNDSHKGSKADPWKTVARLMDSGSLLQAGDSIFFERGSTFFGQLTIMADRIFVGAYGKGPKPILTGRVQIQSWTSIGKNTWKAKCPDGIKSPADLYLDGRIQQLGRYPNDGYLDVSTLSKKDNEVIDKSSQFSDSFWDGAELVVRSSRWTLDYLPVTAFKTKTFYTAAKATNTVQPGMGYFVQSHPATLDQAGEWYFSPLTEELFLYLNNGTTPNDHRIEISVYDAGLYLQHADRSTVAHLDLRQYRRSGVIVINSHDINVRNLDISHSGENGLEIVGCERPTVENNFISDANNNGVEWRNNQEGSFNHNTIRRIGLVPGRGNSGNGTHIGLNITSDYTVTRVSTFEYNTIDSTGYSGIDFRTGRTHIRYNLIKHFCLLLDDGAGIYTWNNRGGANRIEENTISDGIGSGDGTLEPTQRFASGIYIDDLSSDFLVKNNKVARCALAGILLHNAKHIQLTGNVLADNGYVANKEKGQLFIKIDTLGTWDSKADLQLKVTGNTFVARHETSYCIFLSADRELELRRMGSFRKNTFRSVHDTQAIAESNQERALCQAPESWTLTEWQQVSGYETESSFRLIPGKESASADGPNLIANSDMTINSSGWIAWPKQSSLEHVRASLTDGHSLKVTNDGNFQTLLYHAGFPLTAGKLYRLQFSVKGVQQGKLEFVALMAHSPWSALSDYTCFSIQKSYRTFTYYFIPAKTTHEARVNFKSHITFWLDQVTLREVTEEATLSSK